MADNITLPNKVRFTVIVASTSSVSTVLLTDGSQLFDVYWNINMTGPDIDDPNVVITDNKIISWTQTLLSMY